MEVLPRLSVIGDRTRGLDREVIKTEPGGEEQCTDVMKIDRPDDLADIADLGLTFAEAERLLGGLQQEIVAAQVRVMPFPGRTAEAVAAFAV
jgi:hypothetical protein